jgi:hypothetical protein
MIIDSVGFARFRQPRSIYMSQMSNKS